MSQINPNLNNILHKKQINPSFKSDNPAYNQPVQPEMYYEDGVEQQEYYYPDYLLRIGKIRKLLYG